MEAQEKGHPILDFFLYIVMVLIALFLTNSPLLFILGIFTIPISIPIAIIFGKRFAKEKLFVNAKWGLVVIQVVLVLFTAFVGALSTSNAGDPRSSAPYIVCMDGCMEYWSFWNIFIEYLIISAIMAALYHTAFYISYFRTLKKETKKA